MKLRFMRVVLLLLIVALLVGCTPNKNEKSLNDVDISQYTIVYSQEAPDYCQRAAEYIQAQVLQRTGVEIPVCEASSGTYDYEILVGDTDRAISKQLTANDQNMEFSIAADANHIAMNADYFIIAAAAYFFVETYIPGSNFTSKVPNEVTVHTPITEKANNFIFLIGDGMGPNHVKLFGTLPMPVDVPYSDNEEIFYGYYLPYQGMIHTDSYSGITDSAAGATALACGYKTINSYVGQDPYGDDVQSLTELAIAQGKATAVMSTDVQTGATPSGFSAHVRDRNYADEITADQEKLMMESDIIIECGLHATEEYQYYITEVLDQLDISETGFFIMYEEGYIDKFSHDMNLEGAYSAMFRFNQAIGLFMEYAFYHPDTFLLITADHETGDLQFRADGSPEFNVNSHTGADVPIFAYGQGAEVFQDYSEENNEVPKIIAKLWGVEDFGG